MARAVVVVAVLEIVDSRDMARCGRGGGGRRREESGGDFSPKRAESALTLAIALRDPLTVCCGLQCRCRAGPGKQPRTAQRRR
ncbi:hypothetical protein BT67DRAFT_442104 [Trichocladium antarcticum]|uniref:Uncharacterized protein n=1 Tax=Trichocladium antarcticum TaxID=1450529 RepID=A0AAN6UJL0_9PEZI|nr:hypothetical protein BT67DRAFT_442104 [Trichocladium antarcticum]